MALRSVSSKANLPLMGSFYLANCKDASVAGQVSSTIVALRLPVVWTHMTIVPRMLKHLIHHACTQEATHSLVDQVKQAVVGLLSFVQQF